MPARSLRWSWISGTSSSRGGRTRRDRWRRMPNPAFWNKRRVFLTGHTGFKGSWLSLWLHALGADVTGYALDPPTDPNLFCQARVEGTLSRSIHGDIRDFAALKDAIDHAAPDVVIHMAAQSVVRRSYQNPIETYSPTLVG